MKKHRRNVVLSAILLAMVLGFPSAAGAAKAKEYAIGVYFDSTVGGSASQWYETAGSLLRVGVADSGVPVRLEKFSSEDEALDAFLKGKIEGVRLWSQRIITVHEKKIGIYPWATYTVEGRRKTSFCFWSPKSAAVKNVAALEGKTLVRDEFTTLDLIMIRDFLQRNGIDKPLWKVFESFIVVPGANSAFLSVAMGKADLTWDRYDWKSMLKILMPSAASKLTPGLCTEEAFARWAIVFNKKLVVKDDIPRMRQTIERSNKTIEAYAKKDPGMLQLKQYMKMAKVKAIPADDDEVANELAVYRKAKSNGWLMEAEFILAQMKAAPKGKPVKIKTDYGYCRKKCGTGKNQVQCIDDCI